MTTSSFSSRTKEWTMMAPRRYPYLPICHVDNWLSIDHLYRLVVMPINLSTFFIFLLNLGQPPALNRSNYYSIISYPYKTSRSIGNYMFDSECNWRGAANNKKCWPFEPRSMSGSSVGWHSDSHCSDYRIPSCIWTRRFFPVQEETSLFWWWA